MSMERRIQRLINSLQPPIPLSEATIFYADGTQKTMDSLDAAYEVLKNVEGEIISASSHDPASASFLSALLGNAEDDDGSWWHK